MTGPSRRVLVLRGDHPVDLVPRFGLTILSRVAKSGGRVPPEGEEARAHLADDGRWVVFTGDLSVESAPALCSALGNPSLDVELAEDGVVTLRVYVFGDLSEGLTIQSPGTRKVTRDQPESVGGGWRGLVLPELLPEFPDGWPDPAEPAEKQLEAIARLLGTTPGDLAGKPTSALRDARAFSASTGTHAALKR